MRTQQLHMSQARQYKIFKIKMIITFKSYPYKDNKRGCTDTERTETSSPQQTRPCWTRLGKACRDNFFLRFKVLRKGTFLSSFKF